ncbi:MAG: tRNA-(ms[2]io[6]A)-hydroxylase [Gammaproteobacteria bacterium]|nr:tRNA-(ms[2]io[6]A)-hydroxylase [Gammaproteobacteria bacterium]MCD8524360.1 tRNA-(ms[2]io[6]A)-hydroxylase [Gammaproteobacteria bacterium]MCD8541994.1 tRNA-(ms[2]io[6]A)-hydroxylase [Gammaproteobacteria bacterium]
MQAIQNFLLSSTPILWLNNALKQQDILLIDHALCEKKAASSAVSLMHRYPERDALLKKMSRLAREELKHFEMVLEILRHRGIAYKNIIPSGYVQAMRSHIRAHQPARLVDELIIGAIIEARSCERFSALIPHLDRELAYFYSSLLASESRHFNDYLTLARMYANEDIHSRIQLFTELESSYIQGEDSVFRFHSGYVQGSMESY